MKKAVMFGILFILSVFLVNAVEFSEINLDDYDCLTSGIMESEFVGTELPEQIPYSNEIFNIFISEKYIGTIVIEEGKITDFLCDESEDRTYDVYIASVSTITDFENAEDPVGLINEKLGNGEIELKGATIGKKVKMFFTKIGLKIASWFI